MSDIFGDFRRLVIAALNDLAGAGTLPSGLDFARVAVEPPRDPSHGDLSTNAAMVLAGLLKKNPMELAEKISAALLPRKSLSLTGRRVTAQRALPPVARRALSTSGSTRKSGTRNCVKSSVLVRLTATRMSARVGGSMSSLFRPIPPGRCMSGTGAAR